jgi:hypothetical protein
MLTNGLGNCHMKHAADLPHVSCNIRPFKFICNAFAQALLSGGAAACHQMRKRVARCLGHEQLNLSRHLTGLT